MSERQETVREIYEETRDTKGCCFFPFTKNEIEITSKIANLLKVIAERFLSAYEREMAAKDAEIARHERCYHALEVHCKKLEDEYLKAMAALKPVMECDIVLWDDVSNAVREAQRIMKESYNGESHN